MKAKRRLHKLQLSRAAMCPVCGALPFQLCMNIPHDPQTITRFVHGARLKRVREKFPALVKVREKVARRLRVGRELKAA